MTRVQRSFKVQFDKGESREESLLGRQYLVVPVIAMVEGVRFGAGQTEPELGLASEFGKNPILWANRPLVLNHPKVGKNFVSANTPEILEKYQFGLTMNPQVKDSKLHMEAWIDIARVEELGGDFQDTYDRIVAQEDVEVSVGFFSDLKKQKGKFRGQAYGAIWQNIAPDHLAILEEGTLGACSIEDGCGVPRINEVEMTKAIETPKTQCSCGGNHTQEEHQDDDAPVTQKGLAKMLSDILKPFTQSEQERLEEGRKAIRAQNHTILGQEINTDLMDSDVRKILSQEGSKKFPKYAYLYGYNQNVAVFERYNEKVSGYELFQIGFNINGAKVEFVGEPEQVILQTKIVPVDKVKLTAETENDMTQQTPTAQATQPSPTPNPAPNPAPAPSNPPPPSTVTQAAPKVQTIDEYIAAAPPEMQEMLKAQKRSHDAARTAVINTLKAHKSNKFSDDELNAMTLETLEKMASYLPGTYAGVAPATQTKFNANANENKDHVPAPKVFTPKNTQAA
jgi:hypothetical protein